MDLSSVAEGVLASVLSPLSFWVKRKLFPIPRITGRWFFEMKTTETSYNPYKDMILQYVAIVSLEGKKIEGTVEKIYENSSTGEREYIGKNRTRGKISGYVEKNYIYLHIVENGHGREYTTFFELIYPKKNQMTGKFTSTAADQAGDVKWQRETFQK